MLRNRFTRFSFLLLAAFTTVAIAAPPKDKGGGGKGDEEPPTPPPTTFVINWIEDFQINRINYDADMLGEMPSLDGTGFNDNPPPTLIYGFDRYFVDSFFAETGATLRYCRNLSDRLADGSLYLCGTCDTVDGIRGWRMKVSPTEDGLERVAFSILQPVAGDTISVFTSINVHGEAVGYSFDNQEAFYTYASLYQSDDGTKVISQSGGNDSVILESGKVFTTIVDADGTNYIASWMPDEPVQEIIHSKDVNAVWLYLFSVAESGDFLFRAKEVYDYNRGGSYSVEVQYFYDGTPHYLTDSFAADPRKFFEDLNSLGDLVSRYFVSGKGKNPGRYVNEVHFTGLGVVEDLDNMIDESNLQADIDRWFERIPYLRGNTESGLIFGDDHGPNTSSPSDDASWVLVPVTP